MRRLVVIGTILAASTIGVAAALGIGGLASGSPVPSARADLGANPNGPATHAVTAANRALTACLLANGATRIDNADEPGFSITGITPAVQASCSSEQAAWSRANTAPAYKQEQDALGLVMNRAWSCVAAKGYEVTGFSSGGKSDGHEARQPGLDAAFASCKTEAATSLGVSLP